jgi:hypothetical protein
MGENEKRVLKAVGSGELEAMTGSGWVLVETHRESVLIDPVTGEAVTHQNSWMRRDQYRSFQGGHSDVKMPACVLAERVIFVLGRSENDQLALLNEQLQAAYRETNEQRSQRFEHETEIAKLVKKIAELETKVLEKEEASAGWRKDAETKRGQIAALEQSLSKVRTVIGQKAYDEALSSKTTETPYRGRS